MNVQILARISCISNMTESNVFITAAQLSAQTDPTHLQISRDHRYCRQHVSCETSISVWPENTNTSVQAIAAIPALLIKLRRPNPIFVAICFTWSICLFDRIISRKGADNFGIRILQWKSLWWQDVLLKTSAFSDGFILWKICRVATELLNDWVRTAEVRDCIWNICFRSDEPFLVNYETRCRNSLEPYTTIRWPIFA